MLPTLSSYDCRNVAGGYSVSGGKVYLPKATGRIVGANGNDFFFGQLATAMPGPGLIRSVPSPVAVVFGGQVGERDGLVCQG